MRTVRPSPSATPHPGSSPAAARGAAAAVERRGPAPPVTPITAAECPALIAGLRAGTVDPYDVQQRIIATVGNGRVWHTAEWRAMRDRLLKNRCEQCGEPEGPLTLQHLRHPARVDEIEKQLRAADRLAAWEAYRAEHEGRDGLEDLVVPVGPERPGCPVCGGYNLRERKSQRPRCWTTR